MIKRMHHRAMIILAVGFGLMLDSLLWLIGQYVPNWAGGGVGAWFNAFAGLSPWLAAGLIVFGILELNHVKHHR
jgi:hypothetical protein